eukprot:CAMPEP_0178436192 /NCGR_PEP_ID=MMETSP0689_2-20121128/34314_1 /TAXON_ID=160604 /ORGANISM="Amphidinium massartii, Strain CS-259" /LENGTH=700 /DNA_ID=CAMNT_0020058283 /DNA_START=81 /DNA_END=2179 /DNA_ORIENTATION=+
MAASRRWTWGLFFTCGQLLVNLADAQLVELLMYRQPAQCERMSCLSPQNEYCKEHHEGYSLAMRGCPDPQICTNCVFGNDTHPTQCTCENPPYEIIARYGELCDTGRECEEGVCFRPCSEFFHVTKCPEDRCFWNQTTYTCQNRPATVEPVLWTSHTEADVPSAYVQGQQFIALTGEAHFPMSFATFKESISGYMLRGLLLEDVITPEAFFLELDHDVDGLLTMSEYMHLPDVLQSVDDAAVTIAGQQGQAVMQASGRRLKEKAGSRLRLSHVEKESMLNSLSAAAALVNRSAGRRLQDGDVSAEACGAQIPKTYFCNFDQSCKLDCAECGWKSAHDEVFSTCVQPSAATCNADGGQEYCISDQRCKPDGDCSQCVDRPVVDNSQHTCLAVWWGTTPSTEWTDWVCRFRNKVGMPCRHDQDCVTGMKRCLGEVCQPLQPYNPGHICETDHDCPHLGYYCPTDPTDGRNQYWVNYCREQRSEGMTCQEDRECGPTLRCNTAEPQARCRELFSLEIGFPSKLDTLCRLGWRDRFGKCAVPAKSKDAGRSCSSDRDCVTTDQTGRTGSCVCKAWWQEDDSKYCLPVAGDLARHMESVRNYEWFRSQNCGSFWTEAECLRIFGDEALVLKLAVDCEVQQLASGPYLPPIECGVSDPTMFADPCGLLANMTASNGKSLTPSSAALALALAASLLAWQSALDTHHR